MIDGIPESGPWIKREDVGDAVLFLGDCIEILPYLPKVDCVLTDPPYGMEFRSNYRHKRHDSIANDTGVDMLLLACNTEASHSRYVFCRWDNLAGLPKPKSVITWVKNNWSMGDLEHEHARQTEMALFFPGPEHKFPDGRPTDVVMAPRSGNGLHPTEKPVYLMEQFVRWTDGTVIDPFMGSGTTGVACMNMGRKFIGIEINETYFQIACERIENAQRQQRLFE